MCKRVKGVMGKKVDGQQRACAITYLLVLFTFCLTLCVLYHTFNKGQGEFKKKL
jgi:predicted membrane channel-forming protein YqfA (hemolysin III family)